jgi:hypothetical protein
MSINCGTKIGFQLMNLTHDKMKTQERMKYILALGTILALIVFSCSPKSSENGNLNKEISKTSITHLADAGSVYNVPVDTNNGVKVPIDVSEKLDWKAFKNQFHQAAEEPAAYPGEIAVGSWTEWEDYEYQRVYRLENNNLWIQTYYKKSGISKEIDNNAIPKALTLEESETLGLGRLWNDMLERGLFLTDSLDKN